jgi:hypothetical protein
MGVLAPWHDLRHRVGRAGFNRRWALLLVLVFFSFDCSFATFKLNLYFIHGPPQHCSQDQKVVPGLIDFSPNTERRPFRRCAMRSQWVANAHLLYVQKTLFALYFEVWK